MRGYPHQSENYRIYRLRETSHLSCGDGGMALNLTQPENQAKRYPDIPVLVSKYLFSDSVYALLSSVPVVFQTRTTL